MSYEVNLTARALVVSNWILHDAVTEQNEAISSEQYELREQIPRARPVWEPNKEQAEMELEPSVRESLAARQQSDPEIGNLDKGSYDEEPMESLASHIRSSLFPVSQSNTSSTLVTKERQEGTLAYNARSTKSSDDFTGSPGRKTRSASVSDASPAMNITE